MCESNSDHLALLFQNYSKEETKLEWVKLGNIIRDTKNYFWMQKTKIKTRFNYDLLTHGYKKSRLFIWMKQNGATNLSYHDYHTMFTKRKGKGMIFDIFSSSASI